MTWGNGNLNHGLQTEELELNITFLKVQAKCWEERGRGCLAEQGRHLCTCKSLFGEVPEEQCSA